MVNFDFDVQFEDFMLYCRTQQLRPKTMASYAMVFYLRKVFRRLSATDALCEPVGVLYFVSIRVFSSSVIPFTMSGKAVTSSYVEINVKTMKHYVR